MSHQLIMSSEHPRVRLAPLVLPRVAQLLGIVNESDQAAFVSNHTTPAAELMSRARPTRPHLKMSRLCSEGQTHEHTRPRQRLPTQFKQNCELCLLSRANWATTTVPTWCQTMTQRNRFFVDVRQTQSSQQLFDTNCSDAGIIAEFDQSSSRHDIM